MTERRREGSQPDRIVIGDASGGRLAVPTFATRWGVVGALDPDTGAPVIRREDEMSLDYRQVRVHDLQQRSPAGVPDRRVSWQVVNDYGAQYTDARPGDSPYAQAERFTAMNRSTREVDGRKVALPASHRRIVASEDGRYAIAMTLNEIGLPVGGSSVEDEEAAVADLPPPDGVAFREATQRIATSGGTGNVAAASGSVSQSQPSVSIGGVTYFGAAAVKTAREVINAGGNAGDISRAIQADSRGQPRPPLQGNLLPTTQTRGGGDKPAPAGPAAIAKRDKPAGYVRGEQQTGLAGTFWTPDSGIPVHTAPLDGELIGTLPMRRDAQVALDKGRVGAFLIKDQDAAQYDDGSGGEWIKGWLMPDSSEANKDTALPGESFKLRPVFRLPPAPPPPPPPPPPEPPPPPDPPPVILIPGVQVGQPPLVHTPPTPEGSGVGLPLPDGSQWEIIHNPDNTLEIRKRTESGAEVGGVHFAPDGTITSIGESGATQVTVGSDGVQTYDTDGIAGPALDSESSVVRTPDLGGATTVTAGDPGYGISDGLPVYVESDGTVTAIGGTVTSECPPLFGGSGALGSVTRSTGTNLEISGEANYVNLTLEGTAAIRCTAGRGLYIKCQGNLDMSAGASMISGTGRGISDSTTHAGGAGSNGAQAASGPSASAGGNAGESASAGADAWAVGRSTFASGSGGGGGTGGANGSVTEFAGNSGNSGDGIDRQISGATGKGGGVAGQTGTAASNGTAGNAGTAATALSSTYRYAFLDNRLAGAFERFVLGSGSGSGGGGGSGGITDSGGVGNGGAAGAIGSQTGTGDGAGGAGASGLGGGGTTSASGGGGGGAGGYGGGRVKVEVLGTANMHTSARISADGGAGGAGGSGGACDNAGSNQGAGGGGGGGSGGPGGLVWVMHYGAGTNVDITRCTAAGGAAGAGGSGGSLSGGASSRTGGAGGTAGASEAGLVLIEEV